MISRWPGFQIQLGTVAEGSVVRDLPKVGLERLHFPKGMMGARARGTPAPMSVGPHFRIGQVTLLTVP